MTEATARSAPVQWQNDIPLSSLFLLWLLLMMCLLSCCELARSEHLKPGTGTNILSSGLRQELAPSCFEQPHVPVLFQLQEYSCPGVF